MKLEYGKQIYYNVCCELQLQISCIHILLLYNIIFFAILYCIYFLERSTLSYLKATLEADQDVVGTCRLPIDQGSLPEAVRAH